MDEPHTGPCADPDCEVHTETVIFWNPMAVDLKARDNKGLLINMGGVIYTDCTGPNAACRHAHRVGMSVHLIPPRYADDPGLLALPTYHFHTPADAMAAYLAARADAVIVRTVTARDAAYARNLPVWINLSEKG